MEYFERFDQIYQIALDAESRAEFEVKCLGDMPKTLEPLTFAIEVRYGNSVTEAQKDAFESGIRQRCEDEGLDSNCFSFNRVLSHAQALERINKGIGSER